MISGLFICFVLSDGVELGDMEPLLLPAPGAEKRLVNAKDGAVDDERQLFKSFEAAVIEVHAAPAMGVEKRAEGCKQLRVGVAGVVSSMGDNIH